MSRSYYSEYRDTFSEAGAKALRRKILAYWHNKGQTDVEVNIIFVDTPSPHFAVRSNIVALGLLGGIKPDHG